MVLINRNFRCVFENVLRNYSLIQIVSTGSSITYMNAIFF